MMEKEQAVRNWWVAVGKGWTQLNFDDWYLAGCIRLDDEEYTPMPVCPHTGKHAGGMVCCVRTADRVRLANARIVRVAISQRRLATLC